MDFGQVLVITLIGSVVVGVFIIAGAVINAVLSHKE